MKKTTRLSAIVTRGQVAFVSYCPELGVASQGKTRESAFKNLKEAVGLYLEEVGEGKLKHLSAPFVTTFAVPA